MKKWYKLDNLGKFYAATTNVKVPKVFRYSAVLKEDIDEKSLQKALERTVEGFPNFNVNLRKGVFWYYLEEAKKIPKVTQENLPICFRLYNSSDDFLYRVSYFKRKINFEISHILSDGRGSVEFFKYLLAAYVNEKYGLKISLTKSGNSEREKSEDSFSKYYQKSKLTKSKRLPAFTYHGKKFRNQARFMECHMDAKSVLEIAHQYNTTLTGLLVSVLIYSFKDEMRLSDMKKHIVVDIPVDLRKYFKSSSSMNFFGLTNISYKFKSKDDRLEDVSEEVTRQLKENLTKEKLLERVNRMMFFEKNWFCRFAPIHLKNLAINIGNLIAADKNTTSVSNIGIIRLDEELEKYVEGLSVLTATTGFQFILCTYGNDLCIGISSRFVQNDVIKNFCRFFSEKNLKVRIDVSEVEQ